MLLLSAYPSVLGSLRIGHAHTKKHSRFNESGMKFMEWSERLKNGLVNRFTQFTEKIRFNRTIRQRIGHRSSAHAQSLSTIAVWLARLVARVWSHCQEIRSILICGQVKSIFIYLNRPNRGLSLFLISVAKSSFPSAWAFVEKLVFIAALFVSIRRFILTLVQCESRARSVYSRTRVAFHAHFDTS